MKSLLSIIVCALVLGGCATSPQVSDEHVPAKAIYQTKPIYPFELSRAGVEGKAVVEFIVDTEGRVTKARVVEADHPQFGLAAVACVGHWRFTPAQVGGQKVNGLMRVPIYFALIEEPDQPKSAPPAAVTPVAAPEPRQR